MFLMHCKLRVLLLILTADYWGLNVVWNRSIKGKEMRTWVIKRTKECPVNIQKQKKDSVRWKRTDGKNRRAVKREMWNSIMLDKEYQTETVVVVRSTRVCRACNAMKLWRAMKGYGRLWRSTGEYAEKVKWHLWMELWELAYLYAG